MQFNNWPTYFEQLRGRFASHRIVRSYRDFYPTLIRAYEKRDTNARFGDTFRIELGWYEAKRPYYNVYPAIIPALLKVRLTVPTAEIKPPVDVLLMRLPIMETRVTLPISGMPENLRSMLFTLHEEEGERFLFMATETGKIGPDGPMRRLQCLPLNDTTVEQALSRWADKPNMDAMRTSVKLVCALCLLAQDSDVIRPEVLAGDRKKYAETGDPKYVEKAQRRGVVGWSVGEQMEKVPHYRRGHFAIRWTGQGRTCQRIVYIQPTIVHREVTGTIPTGYLDGAPTPSS